ncbi:MAG TPA: pyridoxal phosphate-dependent aminotransferase [Chloroflexota bacterium]
MEPRLSARVKSFPPSGIRRIFELARQPGVISLAVGEPDFDTPAHIREAAKQALDRGETHYSSNLGEQNLREAIASRAASVSDLPVDPAEEVIVTVGGVEAIYLAMAALLDPGDEVLLPDPGFMVYASLAKLCDAKAVPYSLKIENGFYPDVAEIEKLIGPRTKLIIVNSPGNPTGQVIPKQLLLQIAGIAERHNLTVISDEVYDTIVYDGLRAVSFAGLPGMRERTVTINSFSKAYAMTGWRLGYAIAHPAIIQGMMKVHQVIAACVPTMLQSGAAVALESDQSFISEMVNEYQARRDLITDLLNQVPGFRCIKPEGAFYAFPDIRGTGMSSFDLCEYLLKEAKVGCVPGNTFGAKGEGFVRITYAASRDRLQEAGERMRAALSKR